MKKVLSIFIFCICLSAALIASAADAGEYFFKNNISGDTRLIDMHMLGAHDAFTASLNSSSPADAAGVKAGDSGAQWAQYDGLWSAFALNSSKAQSADVETLLNSGVRYFDVRVSKYISGGEFYTAHGRISDKFTGEGGIARKIAAWAQSHPGEIIVLDFQSLFDIDTSDGKATQDSWRNLASKLTTDGIMNYVYTKNGSVSSYTYDSLTNGGKRCAIVVFGQVTGSWADDRFINRRDEDGYMRSYWTDTSSYENMYKKLGEEVGNLMNNSGSYFYKFRVMQAQTTGSNLIQDANSNNIKMLQDGNFDKWNALMPVLMVDNATTDADNFNELAVEKLAMKNREYTNGIYRAVCGNVVLTGKSENVPLGTVFSAEKTGSDLILSLSEGNITGEMTLVIKSEGKKQKLLKDGVLLGETGDNGLLKCEINTLGRYTLIEEGDSEFTASMPLLWYNFTDENIISDIAGNGLDAEAVGEPEIGKGKAVLSDGNVIKLPSGITKRLKNYTVTGWVKMTAETKGSRLFDIGRDRQSSIFAHAGTDKVSSGYKYNGNATVYAEGKGLTVGEWAHVAAVYNNGTLTVYVNGKAVSSKTTNEPAPNFVGDVFNPNGNFIGRTQWYFDEGQRASNPDLNAEIADFRIYDSALNQTELARLARTPQIKTIDITTGEVISIDETDVSTAYSGNGIPAYLDGGYRLEKISLVEDMAGDCVVEAAYKKVCSVTTEEKDGYVTAKLSLSEDVEGARLYIAVYDGDMLISVSSSKAENLAAEVRAEIKGGQTYKVYVWDGKMRPMD